MTYLKKTSGTILIPALIFSVIASVFIVVLVNIAIANVRSANYNFHSGQAFQIAEAGIEYYRWHLAHAPNDFQNGTGQPGPYTLNYNDKDGNPIGQIILNITAPPVGSTVVVINSTGKLNSDISVIKVIEAKLAIPSFAKYAVAANDNLRFGQGTIVNGQIQSNGGIRFDGIANNIVASALSDYDDPDHTGNNEFGVHTHVNPPPGTGVDDAFRPAEAPPNTVPNRSDVFLAGRQFPVPAIDFTGLTANLAQIKTDAQASGLYFGSSGASGYEVVLNTNDTFSLYKINSLTSPPKNCANDAGESGWGTWSINSTSTIGTYNFPANGLVFFEDHVWVSGKINTARLTIASGRFPEDISTNTSITVNNNLSYTNYDGQDVLSLIAQNNFNVGLSSKNDQRIDGALIAKNGRAGRYYYRQPTSKDYCGSTALRNSITLYGMLASNKRYGFSWVCGGVYCSGYATRNITYDANLLYGPPPSFPLTSDQYQIVSWQELK